jgi:hypothetical protein
MLPLQRQQQRSKQQAVAASKTPATSAIPARLKDSFGCLFAFSVTREQRNAGAGSM